MLVNSRVYFGYTRRHPQPLLNTLKEMELLIFGFEWMLGFVSVSSEANLALQL